MSTPRTVLVTGACGFIGSWILRQLLDQGDRPVATDMRRETSRWNLVLSPADQERIPFHGLAIDDGAAVRSLIHAIAPQAIIHLAGMQVPACREDPVRGAQVNLVGTLHVFEAARTFPGARPPIVYASSAAVLGPDAEHPEKVVNDASVARPTTQYGALKLCTEHCATAYWLDHRLVSVGLRPLTVYGPGRDTGMTSFPTRAMAAAVAGQRFTIPFSGPTAYVHVREVANMFVTCAAKAVTGARTYTVGGDVLTVPAFITALDTHLPGAARLISCSPGELPIVARLDDSALRVDYPGLLRLGIDAGIEETLAVFRRLHAAGTLRI